MNAFNYQLSSDPPDSSNRDSIAWQFNKASHSDYSLAVQLLTCFANNGKPLWLARFLQSKRSAWGMALPMPQVLLSLWSHLWVSTAHTEMQTNMRSRRWEKAFHPRTCSPWPPVQFRSGRSKTSHLLVRTSKSPTSRSEDKACFSCPWRPTRRSYEILL